MCEEKTSWQKCVEFHGHQCPGLTIGFRQGLIAMEKLGIQRAQDEELLAILENDACGVDAVQVLTGCTLGKGNLIFKNVGKQALTLASPTRDKAVRVVLNPEAWQTDPETTQIRDKVMSGQASDEEKKIWNKARLTMMHQLMQMPENQLATVKEVPMPQIEKARLFSSLICRECGESVAESRARLKGGKAVCLDCAGEYTRGW